MRRRGKLLIWLSLAALAVAAGALMPGLALGIQDRRLENGVESAQVETVDLSLLSELTPTETLYLANHYDSYVVLERGRLMTAQDAADAVSKNLTGFLQEGFGFAPVDVPEVASVEPRLYMGENGENVVFWYVELGGRGVPLPMALLYGEENERCPVTGSVLLDERTGGVAALDISWHPQAPDTTLPEEAAAPYDGAETAMEIAGPYDGEEADAELEMPVEAPALDPDVLSTPPGPLSEEELAEFSNLQGMSYEVFWWLRDTLGGELEGYDVMPGLYRLTLPDGTEFEVAASVTMYSILFNR